MKLLLYLNFLKFKFVNLISEVMRYNRIRYPIYHLSSNKLESNNVGGSIRFRLRSSALEFSCVGLIFETLETGSSVLDTGISSIIELCLVEDS